MKIYTGRRLAKALREDVNFMSLAVYNRPDFLMDHGYTRFSEFDPYILIISYST